MDFFICVWSINGKTYTKMFDKFFDNFDEAYKSGSQKFTQHM
jgi:hypothetical protein